MNEAVNNAPKSLDEGRVVAMDGREIGQLSAFGRRIPVVERGKVTPKEPNPAPPSSGPGEAAAQANAMLQG